jgi:hypothetical protein
VQQTTTVTQYEDKVHLHDLHAKILHLLGLDQEKLTFLRQVRDFHLTDVHGEVAQGKVNRRDADLHSFQSSLDLVASPGMAEMPGEMQTDCIELTLRSLSSSPRDFRNDEVNEIVIVSTRQLPQKCSNCGRTVLRSKPNCVYYGDCAEYFC